ncbi:MAG TPA: SelB C-terminal domain-containing protein, partial [Chthoniobacterales bacterium]
VEVQPLKISARIRGLQSHNQPLEVAEPRARLALNLADLAPEEIYRGALITTPDSGDPSRAIDVLLERSARLPTTARPLRNGSTLNFHYGSARLSARLQLLDRKEFLPNEKQIARLHFASPIFVFEGDRFLLRDASEQLTVAGGAVLDAEADAVRFKSAPQRLFLQRRAAAPNDCGVLAETRLQRDRFGWREELLRKTNFSEEEIAASLKALQAAGRIFLDGKIAVDLDWWKKLRESAASLIGAEHVAHPEQAGLEIGQLRDALQLANEVVFDALLGALAESGFVRNRNVVQRVDHQQSLPAELRSAGERIRAAFAAAPFNPPSRRELASDSNSERALRFLVETRAVVELTHDVLFGAEAFLKMRETVAIFIECNGPATAGQLRAALGSSRRVIVPFLERLDKIGLTIREGDRRRLR